MERLLMFGSRVKGMADSLRRRRMNAVKGAELPAWRGDALNESSNVQEMTEPRLMMEKQILLDIMEYERKLAEELNRAKEEAVKIAETARQKAKESVEREKERFAALDNEYSEKLKAELERQAKIISLEKEEKLKRMENIGKAKIEELVGLALKRITGI